MRPLKKLSDSPCFYSPYHTATKSVIVEGKYRELCPKCYKRRFLGQQRILGVLAWAGLILAAVLFWYGLVSLAYDIKAWL